MKKRIENHATPYADNKRLMTLEETQDYLSLGRVKAYNWCQEIGALRKIGTRVLIDKTVVDKVLDAC